MGTTKQQLADDVGTLESFQLGTWLFFFLSYFKQSSGGSS